MNDEEHKEWLERANGPLVEIAGDELEKVVSLNREMRRALHKERSKGKGAA